MTSSGQAAGQLDEGFVVPRRQLASISGETVSIPDGEAFVHLQLRRFAGCPICNLHLRSLAERYDEIAAAGIREIVVFHSTREELARHQADLPFAVVADPEKALYGEFGVESSPRAVLSPKAWRPISRGLSRAARAMVAKREPAPTKRPHGGRLGLPGDFLIASDGRVVASKYGKHAYDQWTIDELLALAGQLQPTA